MNELERLFWILNEKSKYLDFYLYTTKHSVYTTYCIASSAFKPVGNHTGLFEVVY